MKYAKMIGRALYFIPISLMAQPGSSCTSPYFLSLDGISRNYATSSILDVAKICTSYTGTSPVTWFAFTTNAQAETPLLDLSTADGGRCEIAMYTSCTGNESNILQTSSSMCFDDGTGLWAPSETFTVGAAKTYLLRVKTSGPTTLAIAAKSYTPPNNSCNGAFSIGASALKDNNACHKPGQGITPGQICAYTIENTAFYQYYVASTGNSIINISNIACDNGNGNNSSGFQIGFFTGSCGSLTPLNCTSGEGGFVQATTPVLEAGTKVYVAIDGNAGSNCQYSITALNAYGVLAENFKNFSAWEKPGFNLIKWAIVNENAAYYLVERSFNGRNFSTIGTLTAKNQVGEKTDYSFEDHTPEALSFYRIRQVDPTGKISLSNILKLSRDQRGSLEIKMVNPTGNELTAQITTGTNGPMDYAITNMTGQLVDRGRISTSKGVVLFHRSLSLLPDGKYLFTITNHENKLSQSFIKFH